ncbi:MAG: hypothetical protein SVR94_04575, partial [Pseudomonadota bacterium]|nr:hypothetical protein [Pseudomonadota bacterium]
VTRKNSAESDLNNWVPYIVVLTAWTVERASVDFWRPFIDLLLKKGAVYFACIGTFSEKLHDEIDEFLYQYEDSLGEYIHINIVTTYHKNDTIEEAVDYCIYGTDIRDRTHNCILVVLDSDSIEDKEAERFFLKV